MKSSKLLRNSLTGFTLMEVIVSITILSIGVLALLAPLQTILVSASVSSSQLTAAYLSKEGIEIVRNIRDTNWLRQRSNPAVLWDDGIGFGNWEADYTDQNLNDDDYDGDFLRIDGGFYKYSASGTITPFQRRINTSAGPIAESLKVTVEIIWQERGRSHSFTAQEILYNWK